MQAALQKGHLQWHGPSRHSPEHLLASSLSSKSVSPLHRMWELSGQHCVTVSIIFSFWWLSSMNCQCFPQQRAPCLSWLWLRCVNTLSSTEQLQCKLAQRRANTRAHNRGSPRQSHKRVWRNLTCKLKINKSDCKSWKPKRTENQIPSPLGRKESRGEEISQFSG